MEHVESSDGAVVQQYPGGHVAPTLAPAAPTASGVSGQRVVLMIAAAAGMVGTFLPWINVPIVGAVPGTKGDGWITFGIFAVALFSMLGDAPGMGRRIWIALVGAGAVAVGGYDAAGISARKAEVAAEGGRFGEALANAVSIGAGLYLVIIAGLAVALGALLGASKPSG